MVLGLGAELAHIEGWQLAGVVVAANMQPVDISEEIPGVSKTLGNLHERKGAVIKCLSFDNTAAMNRDGRSPCIVNA